MLEIYFSQLFSNITNPKACFKAHKIRLPFFSYRSLLLSTSVLNDSMWLKLLEGFLVEVARKKSVILTVDYWCIY